LAAFIQWALVSCKSHLTVDITDKDPMPSPTSPHSVERHPEPTMDGGPKPSATDKLSPSGATVLRNAPEPELVTCDQVQELTTLHALEKFTVEREDAEESPAHCTSAEGEQMQDSGDFINNIDIYADMLPIFPLSFELSVYPEPFVCPEMSTSLDSPPTLLLLPPPFIPAASAFCVLY
ncbi:hypothetical protein M9458_052284, partial [Cirrhinus mrigala]